MRLYRKRQTNTYGMTLIELILAMAILSIILIAFLNGFGQGVIYIFGAGEKTKANMQIQSIIDELAGQKFKDYAAIDAYLGTTKGYNKKNSLPDTVNYTTGKNVNYFIGSEETKNNVLGYQTTIVVFVQNGNKYAKITVFIVKGGV